MYPPAPSQASVSAIQSLIVFATTKTASLPEHVHYHFNCPICSTAIFFEYKVTDELKACQGPIPHIVCSHCYKRTLKCPFCTYPSPYGPLLILDCVPNFQYICRLESGHILQLDKSVLDPVTVADFHEFRKKVALVEKYSKEYAAESKKYPTTTYYYPTSILNFAPGRGPPVEEVEAPSMEAVGRISLDDFIFTPSGPPPMMMGEPVDEEVEEEGIL